MQEIEQCREQLPKERREKFYLKNTQAIQVKFSAAKFNLPFYGF